MVFHQPVKETKSKVVCHMLKKTDKVKIGDQLAISQNIKNG